MSYLPPPPVDPRSHADFVARTERLLECYTGWRPAEGDPAAALVRVFARMAGHVADRLNRMPDRNFLAFLDLVGVEPRPPQPARVPLTFSLAAGVAADAVVAAGTQVAGQPLEGETEPPVFETERELVVTRTTLDAVVVHEPERDRWADRTAPAAAGTPFAAFEGDAPLPHRLHLSHPHAFGTGGPKTVRLRFKAGKATDPRWPELVEWSWRDAGGEHLLARPAFAYDTSSWEVSFADLPAVPPSMVAGVEGVWLSGRLRVPLRLRDVAPGVVLAGGGRQEPGATLFPFGRTRPGGPFALSVPDVLAIAGADATLDVELDDAFPAPAPNSALRLQWEYGTGTGWALLGRSTPHSASLDAAGSFSDGTGALTRSGRVTFRVPADWARSNLAGLDGWWLRARVEAGGYTGEGGFTPPAVRRLALGYDLAVPPVVALEAEVEAKEEGLLPAAGYSGAAPLDLTTDFLPFGSRPAKGDLFYLALPQLLGKPGARATLSIAVNPFPGDAPKGWTAPVLRWEFWDTAERRWKSLELPGPARKPGAARGFEDRTASLTKDGQVGFDVPELGEVEVNGRRDAWIRVRIAGGDYGTDAKYVLSNNVYQMEPATYRPSSVRELLLKYEYTPAGTPPAMAVLENDWALEPLAPSDGALGKFVPFTLPADLRPSLYLGFRRAGEATGFADHATALYLGTGAVPFGEAAGGRPAEPPVLAWWYWDGAGWARLVARDETDALTRRGLVTFVGPHDFRASRRFGREAFWLRVTVERGGWQHPPRLERVLLNTVWAEHASRVQGEVLGSGTGKPGQVVRTVRAPVLPGERIEVREVGLPSPAEREELEREAGPGAVAASGDAAGALEVWVRWTPVPDFHGSGPASRHYVVDRLTGEVRFGDGTRGRTPPPGRANLRAASYRTGGGPAGNRPAGNLTQLRTTVPYVDRVTNHEPAVGGAAAESLDSLRLRGPRTLRHRGRAVTASDLEDLALEASPEVAIALAIPPREARETGRVRVVVVPRGAEARPVPSLGLLERVEAYLAERLPAAVELEVLGPEWMEVAVTAEVVPATLESAAGVQASL
ncbi:MAG TPA: putative baseplate assembly protein, partial [Longimicrobiaceae bacterium]|nr:putative baseplate assembly protein [Longimicrobiaceae bacterium]